MVVQMGWKIVEHLTASVAAGSLLFMTWLFALAVPLEINGLKLDKPIYSPGEIVEVIAEGRKARWAARFCTALESSIYTRDEASRITQFEGPVNYNDGSIRKVAQKIVAPSEGHPGRFYVNQRVIYRCFGFFHITVSTGPDAVASAWVKK